MSSAQASRTSSASAAQTSGAHSAATVGAVTTESSSGFGSNLAQRRSSQALADSVRLLTIDTSPVKYHPPGEAQETNGNEGGEVGGEDEEESSDWDESDDWSDEEDLAAFEVEVASFLAAIRQESRQWTGHVGTPEHRRRVRCLLNVVHEPRSRLPSLLQARVPARPTLSNIYLNAHCSCCKHSAQVCARTRRSDSRDACNRPRHGPAPPARLTHVQATRHTRCDARTVIIRNACTPQ